MSPRLSVVVPTYRRADRLPEIIRRLDAQEPTGQILELIIVDDASPDRTEDVVRDAAATSRLDIQYLRNPVNLGPAATRNCGWRAARGELVAFLDDDCLPAPQWVRNMVVEFDDTVSIVQGRTVPDPLQFDRRGPFSHTLRIEKFSWRFETCNIAFRRDDLERVQGFDETFRLPYGEDIDLGWRLLEHGATHRFASDAVVHHEITPSSFLAQLRQAKRVGELSAVVARHPGYRRHLEVGVFVEPGHGIALIAAGGAGLALATGRAKLAAVSSLPYIWHRTYQRPMWNRWKAPVTVPLALVIDLRAVASLVASSIRNRTVVL